MFGDRFSSSTSCSRWLHETESGRLDQSLSCRFLKVATHPYRPLRPAHAGRPHPLTYVTNHGDRRLEEISNSALISIGKLLSGEENFMTEQFHPYLSLDLLLEDAPSSRIDLGALPELARSMSGGNE